MDSYLIYIGIALATVLLPGPAVLLTINNAIQRGLSKTLAGILGIALATLLIAIISATSLGVILANSIVVFTIIKIIGATYLIYLGFKMFFSKQYSNNDEPLPNHSLTKCFLEGFVISISNPKAIVFFMSVFPQFIDASQNFKNQFALLSITFSLLVIVIHTTYAIIAISTKKNLTSGKRGNTFNKVCGSILVSFGAGLAISSK